MGMDKTPDLTFLSEDHPEANGRTPQFGEVEYGFRWTLEDGRILCMRMGEAAYKGFAQFIREMAVDDALDAALGSEGGNYAGL